MSRPGEMSDDALRRAIGFTVAEGAEVDRLTEALTKRMQAGMALPADKVVGIGCDATTRAHRRWSRWWGVFAVSTFTAGAVLDTWAYNRHGYPATLTCWTRRSLGMEPRTRYGRLGQAALGSFLLWSLLHLVFGVLGPTRGRDLA